MKRIAYLGLAATITLLLAVSAGAQSQPQSSDPNNLADYARKVRKDTGKTKTKVYDNDNLPKDDKLSVVGAPSAENAAGAATGDNASTAAAPADKAGAPEKDQSQKEAEYKQWQEKITAQKDKIDLLQREFDVLQKEYQLRAAAMYADVGNRLRNQAQWDKQDADYKDKIADKHKALDEAKQGLDDMQEQARKAGVPGNMRDPQ
jgi:hypothetical protein